MLHTLKRRLYLYAAAYFKFWSNISLRRWKPRIIAVTGSVGKTTMLHLLEVQLGKQAHYSHFANSAFGIAFDIVGLRGVTGSRLKWLWLLIAVPARSLFFTRREKFYIAEIDGERPRETEFLARWLKPEVTLWISIGRTHAIYFDAQVAAGQFSTVEEAIAHEFAWLPNMTSKLVIMPRGHKLMEQFMENEKAEVAKIDSSGLVRYKVEPNNTIFETKGGIFTFKYPLPIEMFIQLAILDRVAKYLGYRTQYNMDEFILPPGRSSYFEGIKGVQIIDSTYNAHLISMESSLKMMKAINHPHVWLVIGDMIEQGEGEIEEHNRLATLLASVAAERYILVGRRTYEYTAPELRKMVKHDRVAAFKKPADALGYLKANLTGHEVVFFKGSQYLEGIVKNLLANPKDESLLCRREPVYQKRRTAWGVG